MLPRSFLYDTFSYSSIASSRSFMLCFPIMSFFYYITLVPKEITLALHFHNKLTAGRDTTTGDKYSEKLLCLATEKRVIKFSSGRSWGNPLLIVRLFRHSCSQRIQCCVHAAFPLLKRLLDLMDSFHKQTSAAPHTLSPNASINKWSPFYLLLLLLMFLHRS